MRHQRILVTGGCGFIGRNLIGRFLHLDKEVVSIGGSERNGDEVRGCRYIYGRISRELLSAVDFTPEIVFHLAGGASVGQSIADPIQDFTKTVLSSVVLLEYLRRNYPMAQLVYVSSAAIYGDASRRVASHDVACHPVSPYGVHKRMVESLLVDYARMYSTQSVIVRPFSVYGPGLQKQLLWDALKKAEQGSFEFFGSGRELRDWIYIADLVECLVRISAYAGRDVPIFNAGTRHGISVREILTTLYDVAKINRAPVFLGRIKEGDPERLVADDSAEAVVGPVFKTPLLRGLQEYVEWYHSRVSGC